MATKTNLNAKINEVKDEIPNINNLATSSSLTAVENKKRSASNLVKKTDYNTTINDIEKKITDHNHDEYIATPEFNKLTAENFAAILKQVNLASKSDFVNKTDFDNQVKNVTSNKNELNELAKKVKAISTKGLTKSFTDKFSVINGAKYFFKKYFKAI